MTRRVVHPRPGIGWLAVTSIRPVPSWGTSGGRRGVPWAAPASPPGPSAYARGILNGPDLSPLPNHTRHTPFGPRQFTCGLSGPTERPPSPCPVDRPQRHGPQGGRGILASLGPSTLDPPTLPPEARRA